MKKCKLCGNELVEVPFSKSVYVGMGKWKDVVKYKERCEYCEWKGYTGMGKKLKNIIKEVNNENPQH